RRSLPSCRRIPSRPMHQLVVESHGPAGAAMGPDARSAPMPLGAPTALLIGRSRSRSLRRSPRSPLPLNTPLTRKPITPSANLRLISFEIATPRLPKIYGKPSAVNGHSEDDEFAE